MAVSPVIADASGNSFEINAFSVNGQISWTNAFTRGVCTVESATQLTGGMAWIPQQNYFTTNSAGGSNAVMAPGNGFFRLRAVEIYTNTPQAFTNLTESYGLLHTIAGNGADGGVDGTDYWKPSFEGGYATNATL
jgi:hypothetical protein